MHDGSAQGVSAPVGRVVRELLPDLGVQPLGVLHADRAHPEEDEGVVAQVPGREGVGAADGQEEPLRLVVRQDHDVGVRVLDGEPPEHVRVGRVLDAGLDQRHLDGVGGGEDHPVAAADDVLVVRDRRHEGSHVARAACAAHAAARDVPRLRRVEAVLRQVAQDGLQPRDLVVLYIVVLRVGLAVVVARIGGTALLARVRRRLLARGDQRQRTEVPRVPLRRLPDAVHAVLAPGPRSLVAAWDALVALSRFTLAAADDWDEKLVLARRAGRLRRVAVYRPQAGLGRR
mmetsp:Transcript_83495/g.236894  ORF Transcript_83495/g.236894 Transcript_83495/m.236894 type:complete len:287 (-) Transcript_83495:224-1084(-)